jgi:hypothetical protein
MQTYLNDTGVSLALAAFLATDHYDYVPDAISATALMRPLRQQILLPRVPAEQRVTDIVGLTKSRMGTAIHDGIDKVWNEGFYKSAMLRMGHPQKIVDRIVVNPESLKKGDIPVYTEQRSFRSIEGKTISGKYDFVAEGRVQDFKNTSTFTYTNETKSEDYALQGSIYRWLNPKIITDDFIAIQFMFWDWVLRDTKNPKYPQHPAIQKLYPLLSLDDTEAYIVAKLRQFEQYKNSPEPDLPKCTDKELWRKDPVWKYYKSGKVAARSTKNFDTPHEAQEKLVTDGSVGLVLEVPGQVVACKYCDSFDICTQKDEYIADGTLKL